MDFGDCTECGEYKYLEDDSKCPSCVKETIEGKVQMEDDGTTIPIPNATVEAYKDKKVVHTTETDNTGQFTVPAEQELHRIVVSVENWNWNGDRIWTGTHKTADSEHITFTLDTDDSVSTEINNQPATVIFPRLNSIANIGMLQAIGEKPNEHYSIIRHMDVSVTQNWTDGFRPIDTFSGQLDGGGFIINNLHINRHDDDNVGIVRYNQGLIKKLHIDRISVEARKTAGSIAGSNLELIYRCKVVDGTVVADGEHVGGLVGNNEVNNSRITESMFSGDVRGVFDVGGIAGKNDGDINNCYTFGVVHGEENIGGLVGITIGTLSQRGIVQRSFTAAQIQGNANVGAIIGNSKCGRIDRLYWNTDNAGCTDAIGTLHHRPAEITGLTTSEMQGQNAKNNMEYLSFGNIWDSTNSYPSIW